MLSYDLALALDLDNILRDIFNPNSSQPTNLFNELRNNINLPPPTSNTIKKKINPKERQMSIFAKEIIEERRVPDGLKEEWRNQNKYGGIVNSSYTKKAKGRVISHDTLELPPDRIAKVKMRTYCLDRPLPAPSSGEKMHLLSVNELLNKEFIPIYERLMSYSASHPEKNLQIQRIAWFMRYLSEEIYVPSYDLVNEDRALLEEIYPGSMGIIEKQKNKILVKQQFSKFVNVLMDKALPPEVRGVLANLSNLGFDINNPPRNLEMANDIVAKTLQIINSMQPQGNITEDYSEYTLLPNDIAVKTEHPGGASSTVLTVANPTPEVKTIDFKQYALEPGRSAQRLGLGGIEDVEWIENNTIDGDNIQANNIQNNTTQEESNQNNECPCSKDMHQQQVDFQKWGWPNPIDSKYMYIGSYNGFLDPKYPRNYGNHLGMDLFGFDPTTKEDLEIPLNTPVCSMCKGTVEEDALFVGSDVGDVYKSMIAIKCDEGPCIIYGHIRQAKDYSLKKGDNVKIRQKIGVIGPITDTSALKKSHLHLGVNTNCWVYYYHDYEERTGNYAGWGIAPIMEIPKIEKIAKDKGWVDPLFYFCNNPNPVPVTFSIDNTSQMNIVRSSNNEIYNIDWSKAQQNGWENPLGKFAKLTTSINYDFDSKYYSTTPNNRNKRHTGIDIYAGIDADVYAIAPGYVEEVISGDNPEQMVVIIRHNGFDKNGKQKSFFTVYGNVKAKKHIKVGILISAKESIGNIVPTGKFSHLHFSINTSPKIEDFKMTFDDGRQIGWGRTHISIDPKRVGWVDPINFLSKLRATLGISPINSNEALQIISSLNILESPPYRVGETIHAEFTIKNVGTMPIELTVLTVGGRLNDTCPQDKCPDFEWERGIVLNPEETYDYSGSLKIEAPGTYHFFTTCRTEEGWDTNISTAPGIINTVDIVVESSYSQIDSKQASIGTCKKHFVYTHSTHLIIV
ncbi:MAG TPA: M23 family metallopeptidase [Candidatus Hydrogenedens sp.]|nr:M23 family metallopeptidase [Candidatus Hydrogenedens sp.]